MEWTYDANPEVNSGQAFTKLKKATSAGDTKHYINGIEYDGTVIEAIYHAEGRASLQGSTYRYEYTLRDHLGNSRVMFADLNSDNEVDETEILQQNHYYPFGMNMEGAWSGGTNKYQYNGKEIDNDFGLDWYHYGARMYDAAVARFTGVDPLANMYQSHSPYGYVLNNPTNAIDPDGNLVIFVNGHWNRIMNKLQLGPGAPKESYWNFFNKNFIKSTTDYFSDNNTYFVDGSTWFGGDQSGGDRFKRGYEFAKENYDALTGTMKEGETIKFVSHSEGGAFAAGMMDYFLERKIEDKSTPMVTQSVFLSPDEADEFNVPSSSFSVRVTDDLDPISPAGYNLQGTSIEINLNDSTVKDVFTIHGSTISPNTYQHIQDAVNQFANDPDVVRKTTSYGEIYYRGGQ